MAIVDRIETMITPEIEKLGYELVRVQLTGGGGNQTLQIMAERQDGGPMQVEDCETISNQISALLDASDPIAQHYVLEVSSPGIDRPLTRLKDFQRYSGFEAKVQLRAGIEGQRNFSGKLKGVDGETIALEIPRSKKSESREVRFPFTEVEAARLVMTDELMKAALQGR